MSDQEQAVALSKEARLEAFARALSGALHHLSARVVWPSEAERRSFEEEVRSLEALLLGPETRVEEVEEEALAGETPSQGL